MSEYENDPRDEVQSEPPTPDEYPPEGEYFTGSSTEDPATVDEDTYPVDEDEPELVVAEPVDLSPRGVHQEHASFAQFQEERYEQARVDPDFAVKEAIVVDPDDVDVQVPPAGTALPPVDDAEGGDDSTDDSTEEV